MNLSYWEIKSWLSNIDYTVVGSGIVGLNCALELKNRFPKSNILILEKGILPQGASTKNAGFACFGSLSELIDDLFTMTEEEVVSLVNLRLKGLSILKDRLGEATIDYQQHGGYELINQQDIHYLEKIDYINELLRPVFGRSCYQLADKKITDFGFSKAFTSHLVYTPFEGQIDTGKMMHALIDFVRSRQVEFITGTTAENLLDNGKFVELSIDNNVKLTANQVLVATNGFASELFPDITVKPGRGLVMATAPIEDLKFKGTFHMDKGYYYFRNFADRIILGGGRNLAFATETSTQHEVNEKILTKLNQIMTEVIIPNKPYEIDTVWTGIMGFGVNKTTTVRKHSENISIGVGLGGMGVAIGSIIGERLAKIALGNNKEEI